jgi:hypothetical protein
MSELSPAQRRTVINGSRVEIEGIGTVGIVEDGDTAEISWLGDVASAPAVGSPVTIDAATWTVTAVRKSRTQRTMVVATLQKGA